MDYQRLLVVVEERRAILLWEELQPDEDDEDGQLARELRLEEIEDQVLAVLGKSGHA